MLIHRQFLPQPLITGSDRMPVRPNLTAVLLWLVALITWLGVPEPVAAQVRPIDIDIERLYSIRSEGPITLRVRMTPAGTALVEGRLEIRLFNGDELLSTYFTGDEIINPPAKTVKYVLPAPDFVGYSQQLDVYVDFVTKQGRYKFNPSSLIMPRYRERDFIVAVVSPANKSASKDLDDLQQGLKLENFTPDQAENRSVDKTVHTIFSTVSPDQLPMDGTSYCGFNMVFIAAEGFAALKESHWPALLDWVDGGGSLCLMPGTNLTDEHIAALNGLLKHREQKVTFLRGPNNDVVFKNEGPDIEQILLRRGLGQIAIVPFRSEERIDPNSDRWRKVASHLWKIRADQRANILNNGKWSEKILEQQDLLATSVQPQYNYYRSTREDQRRLAFIPLNSGDQMVQSIMPSDLRIIPLSLIAFILFLYVLAIGPADYFILGRLKLRKWTWVTFPVTTILFAGGALWMAEWYMNTGDARRSIYVVDIGVEGNAERTSQFEMLFNSRQRVVTTNLRRSLFTPLNHQDYGAGSFQSFQRQRGIGGIPGATKPEFAGRIPGTYTARQLTPKWVPQLNRITSILPSANDDSETAEPTAEDTTPWQKVKFDWQKFHRTDVPNWSELLRDPEWKRSIVEPIQAAFPSDNLAIAVYAGGQFLPLHGSNPLVQQLADNTFRDANGRPIQTAYNVQNGNGRLSFLTDITMRQDGGLFGVVSSIAPHGGRQLEDLSLVDPSDPRQWLLVVGISDDVNWIVYRKLYAGIE